MTEPSVSSSGLNSVDFVQVGAVHSPEDVAWADSCLAKDPDALENGWNSLRSALLETIVSQPDSSAHEMDSVHESDKMEVFSSTEETGDVQNLEKTTGVASCGKASEPSSSGSSSGENTGEFWSRHNMCDVFLPTYNENLRDLGMFDPEVDNVLQTFKLDQPDDHIFKTWDLYIPPEEDNLTKQLNEALTGSSLEPNSVDESKAWTNLKDTPIEDLISGINELSLSPN